MYREATRIAALEAELKEAQAALTAVNAANAILRVTIDGMELVSPDAIVQVRHSPPTLADLASFLKQTAQSSN